MNTLLNFTRAALCAGLLASAWAGPAAAAALARVKSFEGNINFVGTQASLQSKTNGNNECVLATSAEAGISLPSGANIVSATLYWAGSGAIDTEVLLDGGKVSAPDSRRFTSTIGGLDYFAAASDVTSQVQGKTAFTFSGLTVDVSPTYCPDKKEKKSTGVLAGFSLVVVYSHEDEKYRTVNLYEGLEAMQNRSVTVQMRDYTPRTTTSDAGRFGYIVWEGDKTGQQKGDWVSFAGDTMWRSPYAQKDNAFNSKSSANGDENSPGIDFDIFDLGSLPATASKADAVFTTASDRVLLSTAILALPSPPADLSIQKTQAGEFKLGQEIKYTLTVSNRGARADSLVAVKDTLPDALTYVSASGAGWTCSLAGKTVSCSYGKALEAGDSASVVITAKVAAEGKISNTAEVTGTADGVPGNNKSTVEGDTATGQAPTNPYVFTVGECTADAVIKSSGEGCVLFSGPLVAGESRNIYLTRNVGGYAKPFSTTASTNVALSFALECIDPVAAAGVKPRYAGVDLPTCLGKGLALTGANGAAATLAFGANKPSVLASFSYRDVGIVSLWVRDTNGNIGNTSFASRPESLKATYTRIDGEVANPGTDTLAGAGFAEAGEPFRVTVSAYGLDKIGPLPNFGKETGQYEPAKALKVYVQGNETENKLLVGQGGWAASAGAVSASFVWNEVGAPMLAPQLSDYLGTGRSLLGEYTRVGRFYPAYFKTETELGFECLKRMACPVSATNPVIRASFSAQPFGAIVRAFGRNGELQRFEGALVPDIKLGAVAAPGSETTLTGLNDPSADKRLPARKVSYKLGVPFDATVRRTSGWTAPTAVYLRASIEEQRATSGGSERKIVSSQRGAASEEGGMMIVNGRLMVVNAMGSELTRTPVPLRAQFWSGQAWEQNGAVDDDEAVKGTVEFSACRRSLRINATAPDAVNCDTSIIRLASVTEVKAGELPRLSGGRATLLLDPVGANKSGSADLFVRGVEWLPSTLGRVTFGQFRSPVIYVREMY